MAINEHVHITGFGDFKVDQVKVQIKLKTDVFSYNFKNENPNCFEFISNNG